MSQYTMTISPGETFPLANQDKFGHVACLLAGDELALAIKDFQDGSIITRLNFHDKKEDKQVRRIASPPGRAVPRRRSTTWSAPRSRSSSPSIRRRAQSA